MPKITILLVFSFLFTQNTFSQNSLPKRAIGGICNSKAIFLAQPNFAVKTKQKKRIGTIYVRIKIGKDGKVKSAKAMSGLPLFQKKAEESALKSTFQITRLSGEPVEVRCTIYYPVYLDDLYKKNVINGESKEYVPPKISFGILNDKAKVLPMPNFRNIEAKVRGNTKIQIKVNVQTGKVVSAMAISGFPALRKYAVEAAMKAEFLPILKEFPTIYAIGVLVYKLEDFHGIAKINKNPKPLINVIQRGILNDKAVNFQQPSGNCISGKFEVTVLVNVRKGQVVSAKAISGELRSREVVENSALKTKFNGFGHSPMNLFVKGKLVYKYPAKRCSPGVINGQAIYLPKPEIQTQLKKKQQVNVSVKINEQGNVIYAKAVTGNPLLHSSCESAARLAKFPPRKLKYQKYWKGVLVYIFETSDIDKQDKSITVSHFPIAGNFNSNILKLVKPVYPKAARILNLKGQVSVTVLIDKKGNVEEAKAVAGQPLLRFAAEKAALKSKFRPTKLSGKTVKVRSVIVYNFN